MTAASFALLQSFLYLFSARIGCRGFPKSTHFRFALSRKSHRTRGGVTARAVIFPFTATAFCADWLSGLPKIRSFPFCSEPQVTPDARRSYSACCVFSFTATAFCANWLSGFPKSTHFRFALSRKSHRTRGGVTARAAIFPFTATAFGANLLSGFPKSLSLSVHSEPQVPSDARRCHSACCKLTFIFKASCAIIAARPPRLDYAVSEHGVGNL